VHNKNNYPVNITKLWKIKAIEKLCSFNNVLILSSSGSENELCCNYDIT